MTHDTTPTTTAPAEGLTDEQLEKIAHVLAAHSRFWNDDDSPIPTPWVRQTMTNLLASHRALAAQVRVLEWELAVANGDADEYDIPDDVQKIIARRALAALEEGVGA